MEEPTPGEFRSKELEVSEARMLGRINLLIGLGNRDVPQESSEFGPLDGTLAEPFGKTLFVE